MNKVPMLIMYLGHKKNKKINIKSFHIIKVIRYEQNFLREIIFGLTIFSFSDKKTEKDNLKNSEVKL